MPGLELRERLTSLVGSSAPDEELLVRVDWLDHRAADPLAVLLALTLRGSGDLALDGLPAGLAQPLRSRVRYLTELDPTTPHRPTLDEDPDAAVLVDLLRYPLGAPAAHDAAAITRFLDGTGVADTRRASVTRGLLDSDFLYATPECRATLEGRALLRLAYSVAATR